MSTVAVLVVAVALVLLVLRWSGRYGDQRRGAGTSLRRGSHAHTTATDQPKESFATRDEAAERAQLLTIRDGVPMNVYQCERCGKWHLGHDG